MLQEPAKCSQTVGEARVCVLQVGARLHYASSVALARNGMLAALVTDATAEARDGTLLRPLLRYAAPKALARLSARRVPEELDCAAVHSFLMPSLEIAAIDCLSAQRAKSARWIHGLGIGSHRLARRAIRADFFGANTLYVHPCVTTDAVVEAKRRGLKIIMEAISHPFNMRVEREECARYGVRPDQSAALAEDNIRFFTEEALRADRILAASSYVREGLVELGLPAQRIEIIPYGLDEGFLRGVEPTPTVGRALFVGAVNLLKGVAYLAEAARRLAPSDGISIEVVGPIAASISGHPEFTGPIYRGQVPRSEIGRHFLSADVFVFPTLSDGFGLVILEAMAAGLPVIATPNCADLVKDGVNGFTIPIRDPHAIVDRLNRIIRDRTLRERMSEAARATARQNTIETYGTKLANAVRGAQA